MEANFFFKIYLIYIIKDPYFEISTHPPGYENPIKLYRSFVIKQTLNPKWDPFSISVAELGGLDSLLTIDCYDWEKDGANQLIGSLTTTLREFMFGPVQLALVNPEKVGKYVAHLPVTNYC